jgi:predicted phosphodiesterase
MRLAVLADIHSNLIALQAVLDDLRRDGGVNGIIVAGDSLGSGPYPAETLALLRALPEPRRIIRGNREEYLLTHRDDPHLGHQWATLRWMLTRLSPDDLEDVAGWPDQCVVAMPGTAPVRVVHGSPRSVSEEMLPDDEAVLALYRRSGMLSSTPLSAGEMLAGIDEAVLICGHTHLPWQCAEGDRLVLNPGSVGEPFHGNPRAHYALLEWRGDRWQAVHRTVAYDLARLREAYAETGLLEAGGAFSKACLFSCETGVNLARRFVEYARRLAGDAGETGPNISDASWTQAEATFDWDAITPNPGHDRA